MDAASARGLRSGLTATRSGRKSAAAGGTDDFRCPGPSSIGSQTEETAEMPKITPVLWFDTQAEEAAKFYTSIFKYSESVSVARYGPARPGSKSSVMPVAFTAHGP